MNGLAWLSKSSGCNREDETRFNLLGAVVKIYHSSTEVTTKLSHAIKVDSAHDLEGTLIVLSTEKEKC